MTAQPTDASSSFEEAARRVEAEVRRWIANFNDEVVPAVRRDGGQALRRAAQKLQEMADKLDRDRGAPPSP
jgi:hypothetical protein